MGPQHFRTKCDLLPRSRNWEPSSAVPCEGRIYCFLCQPLFPRIEMCCFFPSPGYGRSFWDCPMGEQFGRFLNKFVDSSAALLWRILRKSNVLVWELLWILASLCSWKVNETSYSFEPSDTEAFYNVIILCGTCNVGHNIMSGRSWLAELNQPLCSGNETLLSKRELSLLVNYPVKHRAPMSVYPVDLHGHI